MSVGIANTNFHTKFMFFSKQGLFYGGTDIVRIKNRHIPFMPLFEENGNSQNWNLRSCQFPFLPISDFSLQLFLYCFYPINPRVLLLICSIKMYNLIL